MRTREKAVGLGTIPIEDIRISRKSRDDIPAILPGLQAIHADKDTRDRLFELLEREVEAEVRTDTGRPGMTYWQILVLGVLRVGLGCDEDCLLVLANHMDIVREMLQLDPIFDRDVQFERQTLLDNLSRLTPAMLREVNDLVAATGHEVVRKHAWRAIARAS